MNLFEFDPSDPIPLYSLENILRQGCKDHSKNLDNFLGFEITPCELKIQANKASSAYEHKETWTHISPQIFQTTYLEFRFALELLGNVAPNSKTLVDLGAAYFRIQFVNKWVFENRFKITGFELCNERIQEAKRVYRTFFGEDLNCLHQADICSNNFSLPKADVYFVYDFGTHSDVETLLNKLFLSPPSREFLLIGRGARVRDILTKNYPDFSETIHMNPNFGVWKFKN